MTQQLTKTLTLGTEQISLEDPNASNDIQNYPRAVRSVEKLGNSPDLFSLIKVNRRNNF